MPKTLFVFKHNLSATNSVRKKKKYQKYKFNIVELCNILIQRYIINIYYL